MHYVPFVTGKPQKKDIGPIVKQVKCVKHVSCVEQLSSVQSVNNVPNVDENLPVGTIHQFWKT